MGTWTCFIADSGGRGEEGGLINLTSGDGSWNCLGGGGCI